ncbi:MAG: hypothetical protein R3D45_08310 [Rhizobiaceae bacterium]
MIGIVVWLTNTFGRFKHHHVCDRCAVGWKTDLPILPPTHKTAVDRVMYSTSRLRRPGGYLKRLDFPAVRSSDIASIQKDFFKAASALAAPLV